MADSEVRQKFEEVAREMFGGSMERGPYGNLLDRDSHFSDEYKFADVQAAWKTYLAGMRAGEIARTERSDKDYAIEHAEYLAKAAEHLMDEINKYDMAESTDEEGDCDARSDAWNSLRSAIGEFRKRAKRALPAAPEEKK